MSLHSNSTEELKQSIFRLAQFAPTTADEGGNQVIDYLVLDGLSNYGPLYEVKPVLQSN